MPPLLFALQAEATHGAVYLAMLTERAQALRSLLGNERLHVRIDLHNFSGRGLHLGFSDKLTPPSALWSTLNRKSSVELPGGILIRRHNWPLSFMRQTLRRNNRRKSLPKPDSHVLSDDISRNIRCVTDIAALDHRGVTIGDVVLSTALRKMPDYLSNPCRTPILQQIFVQAQHRVEIGHQESKNLAANNVPAVWASPEPTYLQALLPRTASAQGNTNLMFDGLDGRIHVGASRHQDGASTAHTIGRQSGADEQWSSQLLDARLERLWTTHIPIREHGSQCHSRLSQDGNLTVVIFLHDFADGEYFMGDDGLGSQFQWAQLTIELLRNQQGCDVYIKPHPVPHPNPFLAHKRRFLIDRLKEQFSDKVCWLHDESNPQIEMTPGKSVGITRYGSVAEELIYRGVQTISSSFAPYRDYGITHMWDGLQRYSELLHNITVVGRSQVSERQRRSCLQYVYWRHSQWTQPFWRRAVEIITNRSDGIQGNGQSPDSWESLENFLQVISPATFAAVTAETSLSAPIAVRNFL